MQVPMSYFENSITALRPFKLILSKLIVHHRAYCSQLWLNHSKRSYNKLRVAYNNAYRRVLGNLKPDSASNMFIYNRVENYDAHNRHLTHSLRSRLLDSNNQIIACLNECFFQLEAYI